MCGRSTEPERSHPKLVSMGTHHRTQSRRAAEGWTNTYSLKVCAIPRKLDSREYQCPGHTADELHPRSCDEPYADVRTGGNVLANLQPRVRPATHSVVTRTGHVSGQNSSSVTPEGHEVADTDTRTLVGKFAPNWQV